MVCIRAEMGMMAVPNQEYSNRCRDDLLRPVTLRRACRRLRLCLAVLQEMDLDVPEMRIQDANGSAMTCGPKPPQTESAGADRFATPVSRSSFPVMGIFWGGGPK